MFIEHSDPNILYSPGTWNHTKDATIAYNSGAHFKIMTTALFVGEKKITLHFNLPNVEAGYEPVYGYRIGDYNWVFNRINNTIEITLPKAVDPITSDPVMVDQNYHFIEFWIRTTDINKNRWTGSWGKNNNVIEFLGMDIPDGSVLIPVNTTGVNCLILGASYSEGWGTFNKEEQNIIANNAMMSWGIMLGQSLGFDTATCGFAASGFTKSGRGNAPPITDTYDKLDDGIERDFSKLNVVAFNVGANDSGDSAIYIQKCTEVVLGVLSKNPAITVLLVTPFAGMHDADLKKVVNNINKPNVLHISTVGYYPSTYYALSNHPTSSMLKALVIPKMVVNIKNQLDWGITLNQSKVKNIVTVSKNYLDVPIG